MSSLSSPEFQEVEVGMQNSRDNEFTALYLYGLIPSVGLNGEPLSISALGLDSAPIIIVAHGDVAVLAHVCAPQPYDGDVAQVHAWVLAQHNVIKSVHAETGTILPIRFNSIVAATEDHTAAQVLAAWLTLGHDEIASRLDGLRDRVELGVQVFAGPSVDVPSADVDGVPKARGRAYFQAQLSQRQDRERARVTQALMASTIFDELALRSEAIVVKPKRDARAGSKDAVYARENLLLDVAVLAHPDKVHTIGEYLAEVEASPGISVRFTGPWAPYAFVGALDMPMLIEISSDHEIEEKGGTGA